MNLLSMHSFTKSTSLREYRSRVAKVIVDLLHQDEYLGDVGWEQLDRMPAWILLNDEELDTIVHQVGVVAASSELQKCIDGILLKKVSSSVGPLFLKNTLKIKFNEDDFEYSELPPILTNEPVDTIKKLGASILLSTIESMTLSNVLARRFDFSTERFSKDLAIHCVSRLDSIAHSSDVDEGVLEPLPELLEDREVAIA